MKPIKDSLLSLETSGICIIIIVFSVYSFLLYGKVLIWFNLTIVVGIDVNLGHSSICVKAILLTGVYDIPAKSDVLGFGSHRGPYPCTKCLHPGEVIRTQRGKYS